MESATLNANSLALPALNHIAGYVLSFPELRTKEGGNESQSETRVELVPMFLCGGLAYRESFGEAAVKRAGLEKLFYLLTLDTVCTPSLSLSAACFKKPSTGSNCGHSHRGDSSSPVRNAFFRWPQGEITTQVAVPRSAHLCFYFSH